MFVIPQYPTGDVINAAAVGIVSGLAATGANQVYKQLNTLNHQKEEEEK